MTEFFKKLCRCCFANKGASRKDMKEPLVSDEKQKVKQSLVISNEEKERDNQSIY
jgi:hypothetical protein